MKPNHFPEGPSTPTAGDILQLLIRTTHRLHTQFEEHLAALGIPAYLTGPRVRVLIAIEEEGSIRMSDLASKLGIKARTVTQFVDALEQEALLVRTTDPDDRRATFLQLTEAAPPLIAKARAAMSQASDEVLQSLSTEGRSQLQSLLLRL
ncbi:MarR family transcriptional regulator [Paenibacillus qinlingensis]|uniref:DNA-binding MarR family transcriptional regulator n=1 Tax=Paenibacillus qinlingensis TaxID=1837343 RepID=A0ABU1NQ35_9BACL|nr:MarR family transcriptional regulator [Paenibacillus qinlingensis]MDR6549582.1 DNA-binding MarR family transcriptional regulator [Paenibacillus qinlingensis]